MLRKAKKKTMDKDPFIMNLKIYHRKPTLKVGITSKTLEVHLLNTISERYGKLYDLMECHKYDSTCSRVESFNFYITLSWKKINIFRVI